MTENTENKEEKKLEKPEPKVNELGGFYFSSHLRISDPNTKEVFVQIRGDN